MFSRQRSVRSVRGVRVRLARLGIVICAGLVLLAGCRGDDPDPVEVEGGDPETGAELIQEYGCGECHLIPDIEGADGGDAPGLQLWPNRAFVAGGLDNTPENTRRFIQNPDEIRPGTEMPDLGLSEQEARDITAYLFTLN